MKIRFYSSVIFDALCACAELAEQKDRGNSEKQEFLALLREKTGDVFQGGALSFSTMCGIAARALPDLSTATLDELDKLFADMGALEKAVCGSIRDAFTASYMLPTLDMLKDGWAARYRTYIAVLKKAEFEQLWREPGPAGRTGTNRAAADRVQRHRHQRDARLDLRHERNVFGKRLRMHFAAVLSRCLFAVRRAVFGHGS